MVKRQIILTAFLMLLAFPMLVRADTNISSCSILNSEGETYYLNQSITNSASSSCMNVTANNVTLDCDGYTIDGQDTESSIGIVLEGTTFTTVKNCILTDWAIGINAWENSHYANLTNLTISSVTPEDGITIGGSDYGSLTDSLITGNDGNGVAIQDSYNWTVSGNTISNNAGYGIRLEIDSASNLIYNNLFNDTNSVDVGDSGANDWNTTQQSGTRIYSDGTEIGGNYYTNSASDGYSDTCTDANYDGFCDDALELGTDNWDYLPLSYGYGANEISDCAVLDETGWTYYLTQDTTEVSNDCMAIQADNIILDCQGYTIDGDGSEDWRGVYGENLLNITVKNCDIKEFRDGIYFDNVSTSLVYNNTVYDMTRTGIRCQSCVDLTVEENTIHDVDYGTWTCCGGVNDSVITNNHLYDVNAGVGVGQGNWNITVTNNLVERANLGILLWGVEDGGPEGIFDSLVKDNTILDATRGIYLAVVNNTEVYNNTINSNVAVDRAITIQNSFGNLIYNNLFNSSTTVGFFCDYVECPNDWNTTRQNGTRIYSNGFEIGGNYYTTNITGYSDTCADYEGDGFCSEPLSLGDGNIDYLPMSIRFSNPTPTTTTTLGAIEETLTDIGSGVGGLFEQLGSPLMVFMILIGLVSGLGLLFKLIGERFYSG